MNDTWHLIGIPNVSSHSREGIPVPLTCVLHLVSTWIFQKYRLYHVTSLFQKSSTAWVHMDGEYRSNLLAYGSRPATAVSILTSYLLASWTPHHRRIYLLLREHPYSFHAPSLHNCYLQHLEISFPPVSARAFSWSPPSFQQTQCSLPLWTLSRHTIHSELPSITSYLPLSLVLLPFWVILALFQGTTLPHWSHP